MQINSAGFRDLERTKAKPPNTYRIAVLGDSYVEALQIERAESFSAVIEAKLKNCQALAEKQPEVLSFGISGFGTAQELLLLRHYVWDYHPDLIVLLMCPQNDIADNSRRLTENEVRPFYEQHADSLELDHSFQTHPLYRIAQGKSTKFKVDLINRFRLLQLYARFRRPADRQDPSATDLADRNLVDNLCYFEPEQPAWKEAWSLTERLLLELQQETKQHKVPLYVVIGTTGIQLDPREHVRTAFRHGLDVSDLFYFEQRIENFAENHQISAIGLGQPMAEYAQANQVFLHGFPNTAKSSGHWNTKGHRLAAEIVANRLCRDLKSIEQ